MTALALVALHSKWLQSCVFASGLMLCNGVDGEYDVCFYTPPGILACVPVDDYAHPVPLTPAQASLLTHMRGAGG